MEPTATEHAATESEETEDGSASHKVDPMPPSSFRLFGFGKKDKKDEEPAAKTAANFSEVRFSLRARSRPD